MVVIIDLSPELNMSVNAVQEEELRQCCSLEIPCRRRGGFGSCTALKGGTGGNCTV